MNAPIKTPELDSIEDVTEAIDAWLAAGPAREFKVRKNGIGHTCLLFDRGLAVATARGTGCVSAMANALEELAAKDPDADENRWNSERSVVAP